MISEVEINSLSLTSQKKKNTLQFVLKKEIIILNGILLKTTTQTRQMPIPSHKIKLILPHVKKT